MVCVCVCVHVLEYAWVGECRVCVCVCVLGSVMDKCVNFILHECKVDGVCLLANTLPLL